LALELDWALMKTAAASGAVVRERGKERSQPADVRAAPTNSADPRALRDFEISVLNVIEAPTAPFLNPCGAGA